MKKEYRLTLILDDREAEALLCLLGSRTGVKNEEDGLTKTQGELLSEMYNLIAEKGE